MLTINMFNPYTLRSKYTYGKNMLKSGRAKIALAIYSGFIIFLFIFRNNPILGSLGFYSIFIPLWLFFIVLIVVGYILFWNAIKYFVLGTILLAFIFMILGGGIKYLSLFGPAVIIVSLFIFFAILFIFSLLLMGFLVAVIVAVPAMYITHSPEIAGIAGLMGFLAGLVGTYMVLTRIIFPFSFGFSMSIVAAHISSLIAGILFYSRGFAFSFPDFTSLFSYSRYGDNFDRFMDFFARFFRELIHEHAIIFIGSVIVGVLAVVAVNHKTYITEETDQG